MISLIISGDLMMSINSQYSTSSLKVSPSMRAAVTPSQILMICSALGTSVAQILLVYPVKIPLMMFPMISTKPVYIATTYVS